MYRKWVHGNSNSNNSELPLFKYKQNLINQTYKTIFLF